MRKLFNLFFILIIGPVAWIHFLLIRKKTQPEKYAICRKYSLILCKVWGLKVPELPAIQQNGLIICNHQSTMDPLWIIAASPSPIILVSKAENKKIPLLGTIGKTIEVFYFDREDTASSIHMLRETSRMMKDGKNLLIFAEGTRSKSKMLQEMKDAAFKPAQLAKVPVYAMTLINSYQNFKLLNRSQEVPVLLSDPILPDDPNFKKLADLKECVSAKIQANLNQYA